MRMFTPSTIAHPWRQAMATFALSVYFALALYLLIFLTERLTSLIPMQPWSFVPVTG